MSSEPNHDSAITHKASKDDHSPASYTPAQTSSLAILALALGGLMLISNILAAKVWALGPFNVFGISFGQLLLDGGVLLFPFTYVLGDVIVELYHKRIANHIAIWCAILNAVAFLCFWLVDLLPSAPGVDNVEFSSALSLSGRIIIASVVAFVLGQKTNNFFYELVRPLTKHIGLRAWLSSLCAHPVDTFVFTFIGFWGRASTGIWFKQMLDSLIIAILLETILIPVTVMCSKVLRQRLFPGQETSI